MKKLRVISFGICLSFFYACKKEIISFDNYHVSVENRYFEPIDSIFLDTFSISKLKSNETSTSKIVPIGTYPFKCLTQSGLKIYADIKLIGNHENIIIVVGNNGQISIE